MRLGYIKATAKTLFRILTVREDLKIKATVRIAEFGIPQAGVELSERLRNKLRLLHQAGDITEEEYKKALKLIP